MKKQLFFGLGFCDEKPILNIYHGYIFKHKDLSFGLCSEWDLAIYNKRPYNHGYIMAIELSTGMQCNTARYRTYDEAKKLLIENYDMIYKAIPCHAENAKIYNELLKAVEV